MKAAYHRLAVRDVREILDYYESEAGSSLPATCWSQLSESLKRGLMRVTRSKQC